MRNHIRSAQLSQDYCACFIINTNSLLLQLSCKLKLIHYMGKEITIHFANDIHVLGFDVDYQFEMSENNDFLKMKEYIYYQMNNRK